MTVAPGLAFIGPLSADQQRLVDEVLAADTAAAVFEPMSTVLHRREGQLGAAFIEAALQFQAGDPQAWPAVRSAIAQARALAWLSAADPAGCWDCLLAAAPCERHRRSSPNPATQLPAEPGRVFEPDWRRFGSDAS